MGLFQGLNFKKKIMKKLLLVLTFLGFYSTSLLAQQPAQPSMMILPYTKSGESALDIYQDDEEYRALIIAMEQAFIDNGAELQDLERTILNAKEAMTREANKYIDINDAINRNATTEITIAPEINYQNDGTYVQFGILMKAVDTSTGGILYTGKYISTPPIPAGTNMMAVATNILKSDGGTGEGPYIQVFLAGMRRAFEKMVKEGRAIKAVFVTDDDSDFRLNDEANDDFEMISDLIETWVSENAFNGTYRVSSSSDNRLEFDLIKIAVRDEDGKPFNIGKFAKKLRIAMLKICKKASQTMGDGEAVDARSTKQNIDKGTVYLTMPSYKD